MLIEKTTRLRVLFEDAAESYMQHGGEARYLPKIVEYFRGRCVADICPGDVRQMAMELFPDHLPGSRNRQAVTPARAVLNTCVNSLGTSSILRWPREQELRLRMSCWHARDQPRVIDRR